MKNNNYLTDVRNQYEDYPYPARNPEAEKATLYVAKSTSLDCINHYCFGGARDFSSNFRVLIAGGGTGDDAIYLAEQLRNTSAEVVYLDMSTSSMKIAQERAAIRKLDNIQWIHDSLLNIPQLDIGSFDFISCTGVLHHLEDPQAGLNALKTVLNDDGAMYIMLYATIGRTGIYQMQDLLRLINTETPDIEKQISNAKVVLNALPPGNWFSFNSVSCKLDLATDIGIYDLLLHTQDRAYTVPELYEYIETSGLQVNKLYNPDHPLGDMVFQPQTYIKDPTLLNKINELPFKTQAAICELLFGQLMKQCCFVSFKEVSAPSFEDIDLIPSISTIYSHEDFGPKLRKQFLGDAASIQINEMFTLARRPHTATLFSFIDGERTTREVVNETIKKTNTSASFDQVLMELKICMNILISIGAMFISKPGVKQGPNIPEMKARVSAFYP